MSIGTFLIIQRCQDSCLAADDTDDTHETACNQQSRLVWKESLSDFNVAYRSAPSVLSELSELSVVALLSDVAFRALSQDLRIGNSDSSSLPGTGLE